MAIPVATPKVPTLPPTTVAPRPHPQTTPDAEKGKTSLKRPFKIVFKIKQKYYYVAALNVIVFIKSLRDVWMV